MKRPLAACVAVATALSLAAGACSQAPSRVAGRIVRGGSPSLGADAIRRYGCGSCHTIPGIRTARGLVGPPLTHWSKRSFIAGELSNTPDNLVRWLVDPKAVEPGTDMPRLGLSTQTARNVAAYLEGIR